MTAEFRCRLLATTLLFGSTTVATPALAQDQTAATEEEQAIVVTGSRIARPNLQANSPITVATGEQLTANADVTLDTFLNTLPQANPAGTTTSNNPGNNGQSNIDLRGLGANRNLVLVNGRRPMVSANNLTVDLNTIPQALIGRVDVITGGAGAAYGADAVAGVVNLILRDDFEGLDLRANYANTADSDAREFQASAVIGGNFGDDRGNAVLAFDYSERQGLIKSQRPFAAIATSTTTFLPEGLYFPGSNAPTQTAVNTVFGRYGVAAGAVPAGNNLIAFNLDGTLFSTGIFNSPIDVQNFRYPVDLSVNTRLFPDLYSYNFDEVNLLVLPVERRSIMGAIHYEINESFEPFAQFGYTRYESVTALAPTPIPTVNSESLTGTQPSFVNTALVEPGQTIVQTLVVPVTNPFIPADFRELLASRTGNNPALVGSGATEPFTIRHRTLGAGLRNNVFENEVVQYLGGLRGQIAPGWRYDAYFSEGRTVIVTSQQGAIDTQRLQQLIEAPDGGASLCAGGYNPFGRQPLSQACIDFLEVQNTVRNEFNQRIAQAFVTGELAELPGGTLSMVLGGEWRRFNFVLDPGSLAGPISGPNVLNPAAGTNEFKDIFAELLVPIIADRPWAQSLELVLGWRYSDFSSRDNITGIEGRPSTDHTYKVELTYAPVQPLRFRGSYQRAVRAPNFNELFSAGASAPQYFDPCSFTTQFRQGNLGASTAQALDLCVNANAGPTQGGTPAQFANFVQTPGSQLNITLAGNTQLEPEKADTFTVGLVVNAPGSGGFFSTFRGSIDYYNIRITDAIVVPDPNSVVADCYNYFGNNSNFSPTYVSCESIVRNGGTLVGLRPFGAPPPAVQPNAPFLRTNDAEIQTSGIDAQLSWALPMDWLGAPSLGRFSFDLLINYLIEFSIRDLPGLPLVNYAGTVGYFGQGFSSGGGASFPRWRGSLNTNWRIGDFNWNLRTRYIHKMQNRAQVQYSGETSFTGTDTVWYFDTSLTWNIEAMTFRIGVNNLFNREPPVYAPNVQSGTDPSMFDVIGRRFFAGIGLRF